MGTLAAFDHDAGQGLTYAIAGGADAALFEINASTGALALIAASDFENPADAGGDNIYDVIARVSDGAGGTDERAIAVRVTNLVEPTRPSAGGPYTIEQGQPLTLDATGTVPDTGVSIISYEWLLGGLRLANGPTPTIPWSTLSTLGAGSHTFTVRVLDSRGQVTTDSEGISLTGFNPIVTSNGGGATASISVDENMTSVTTVTALEPNGDTVTYSIVDSADAAQFQIDATTGTLSFIAGPDFEAPADAGGNNIYDVTVQVSDGLGGIDTQAIAVAVTDVNETPPNTAPELGPAADQAQVAENTTLVRVLDAIDPEAAAGTQALSYEISGGGDAGLFDIRNGNELHFINAPDFENPGSANGDNAYDVTIQVSDGAGGEDEQAIAVSVTDVAGITLVGTPGNDAGPTVLVGTPEGDIIDGLAGDDEIRGEHGDDTIIGGAGRDLLEGGDGDDRFIFDTGSVVARETINGGDGTDTIVVGADQFTDFGSMGSGFTSIEKLEVVRSAILNASQVQGGAGQLPSNLHVDGDGFVTIQGGQNAVIGRLDVQRNCLRIDRDDVRCGQYCRQLRSVRQHTSCR